MIATFARRLAEKAAVRGLAFAIAIGGDEIPLVDLRGKLPTTGVYPTRSMSKVDTIVIHHSATRGQSVFNIAEFHEQQKGWPGIGYHFVVEPNATIIWCNSIESKTNHAKDHNTHTVGVCLIGNYDIDPVPKAVKRSCTALVVYLRERYGIEHVVFHRDIRVTDCPGRFAVIELDSLKR